MARGLLSFGSHASHGRHPKDYFNMTLTPLRSLSLLVAAGALSTLAGCDLYFGNHHGNGDTWTYCGSDGQYNCSGDSCEWVSSTCTSGGSGGSGGGSGYQCGTNTDCAAGCYCTTSSTCEEGGFCATNADCGTARSSCEPTTAPTCASNADCTGAGQFCDTTSNTCQTGACASAGTINTTTCTTAAPVCATGQSPVAHNGCFTGTCEATASCSPAAGCKYINDENLCLADTSCDASYTGLNCHDSGNNACHSGQTGCTCESFVFAACADAPK